MSTLISLQNVSLAYKNNSVLENINININSGDIITFVGRNGAGKTSLCNLITGALEPSTGTIEKKKNLSISYVPQGDTNSSSLPITVKKFLQTNTSRKIDLEELNNIVESLQIKDILNYQMSSISGGEKQRVMLARALIKKPQLLILDEPAAFIDLPSKHKIYNLIESFISNKDTAIILVSHDLNFIIKNSQVLCIQDKTFCCSQKVPESYYQSYIQNHKCAKNV